MRRAGCLLALVLWLAACGVAGSQTVSSGIVGRVVAGPTCPVETVPPQAGCAARPLAVGIRIRRVGSRSSRVVHSGGDGRFSVALRPGVYVVQGLPRGTSPLPRPPAAMQVRVRRGRVTHITLTYDTGIR
jgi:hypothetical protein